MNKPIQHAWCEHKSNPERYSGLAELYDEFRPGYPKAIIDELMRIADLEGSDSILDIGCGTGQLAFPLSSKGLNVTAIDLEKDMIELCKSKDVNNNIRWICGRAENVLNDQDHFKLVTMGRSFHWMDRPAILDMVWNLLVPKGICAIIWDEFNPESDKNEWSIRMKDLAARYTNYEVNENESKVFLKHEDVVTDSQFGVYRKTQIDHARSYTIDQVLGHYLSFSWCNQKILGDLYTEFCNEAKAMLGEYSHEGLLEEVMIFNILSMKKD